MDARYQGYEAVEMLDPKKGPRDLVLRTIRDAHDQRSERSIYVCNLGAIIQRYGRWLEMLPGVTPTYAVKTNNDPVVLKTLADLGCSFDCGSQKEIKTVLDMGVEPTRIVFSNPFKPTTSVVMAAERGVELLVADTEEEMRSISQHHPNVRLLLQIKPKRSEVDMDRKYGCDAKGSRHLLSVAKDIGVNIAGVWRDHVGATCGAGDAHPSGTPDLTFGYCEGKRMCRKMDIVSVGEELPGNGNASQEAVEIAENIMRNLDKYFGKEPDVTYMGQTGRYLVQSAFSLAVQIIGKRKNHFTDTVEAMYYLNDGLFGTVPRDVVIPPNPIVFTKKNLGDGAEMPSVLWGPTCTSQDCVADGLSLPDLDIGDWIYLLDMGANSATLSTEYNGIAKPKRLYCCKNDIWSSFQSTAFTKRETS